MTAYKTCHSCGTERPVEQMCHPQDMFWRVLPDRWQCLDAEACFREVVEKAHAAGGARRAVRPSAASHSQFCSQVIDAGLDPERPTGCTCAVSWQPGDVVLDDNGETYTRIVEQRAEAPGMSPKTWRWGGRLFGDEAPCWPLVRLEPAVDQPAATPEASS